MNTEKFKPGDIAYFRATGVVCRLIKHNERAGLIRVVLPRISIAHYLATGNVLPKQKIHIEAQYWATTELAVLAHDLMSVEEYEAAQADFNNKKLAQ